ncbi:MAG: hypothetical protein Ct9H300mP12_00370 [Acidimicrobiales bacterium]|nr:MAG: hypothetical protein Ct9H300mP12_00370 [Acidimicrobiales bacterium]
MKVQSGQRPSSRRASSFIVFMVPNASAEQDAAIRNVLDSSPAISRYTYVDKMAAYEEFQRLFTDKPELVESVSPDVKPPSYRIVPNNPEAGNVAEMARQFGEQPGVKEVATATEAIHQIEDFSNRVSQALLVAAVVLVAVSTLSSSIPCLRRSLLAARRSRS